MVKTTKPTQIMANDGEFVGMLDQLLANAQPKVNH